MFKLFRRKRNKKHVNKAYEYMLEHYKASVQRPKVQYSLSIDVNITRESKTQSNNHIQYSDRQTSDDIQYKFREKKKDDPYDAAEVTKALRQSSNAENFTDMLKMLENNVNQSFVDRLLYYIDKRGVRDSEVYKAAHVDKRLFSKIVSNREYKPSKDTAIALALALELSLEEACDMLSRAGYTFSHSNKRDIIIEYFFREKVYSLIDANDVLYRLNQKIIGRS